MIHFGQFSKLSKANNDSSSILAFLVIEKIQNHFTYYNMKNKVIFNKDTDLYCVCRDSMQY